MNTLCIIRGHKPLVSETFLDAHVDRLAGNKVVLYNYYPEYTYNGRAVRYFYSRKPIVAKLKRLLPVFLYDRWVTRHEHSEARTFDFMSAFFLRHNVDVILAEYGFNGADITPIAKELKIPLVVHFHGHDAHRQPEVDNYRTKYQEMFDYADSIVVMSRLMTETLIGLGADQAKIAYNPYGAREYFFNVQSDYRSTLLAMGRFTDIKAPYLTLMAFKKVAERVPQAKLMMIGDGPLWETCKSLTKLWKLESRVTFTGALTHDKALPLYDEACAFVQHSVTTSYGDAEGMPNSIIEAGAAGLPVVATRHAGITSSVVDGQTGFLVDEYDVSGMANAMCRLLENAERCKTMGSAARKHIQENFGIDCHIAKLQELINQARANSKSVSA